MTAGRIVIAGASGFVGGAAVKRFAEQGWAVTGISRRSPDEPIPGVDHVALDLLDADACAAALAPYGDATHLLYAAVNETPGGLVAGWSDENHIARNAAMFEHLLDTMVRVAPRLQHVGIVHGTKAYGKGVHRHRVIPFRESLPRPASDDFYFHQEDHIWKRAAETGIGWTVYRAPLIVGGGQGSNLNALLAISVLACLCREAGEPLAYPGATDDALVTEMVDVSLLARALEWGATDPAARNQTFNVANGDAFIWPDLWKTIAAAIGVPAGDALDYSIVDAVRDRSSIWADLVRRQALPLPEDPIVYLGESCALADYAVNMRGRASLTSTIKIRQAGFGDCMDSADTIANWIAHWRSRNMLPA
ncbi:MAG: NAD-dependent epimerase/dehydratase family protein [Sphingobium sp.]